MNNTKVFASSIVPATEKLEPIRTNQEQMSSVTIELVHIISFLVVIYFIFGRSIIKALKKEKRHSIKSTQSTKNPICSLSSSKN